MAKDSICERVRQCAAACGVVTRARLRESLGLTAAQVQHAVETLVKRGRLNRIGRGAYEFLPEAGRPREAPPEDRIWHAMRISPKFSSSEIARLAGSTTSCIYKRLRVYRAEGLVAQLGRRQVPGGAEKLWRLTAKGREHIERPAVDDFKPDPLTVAVVRLNRFICTGQVRFVDELKESIRLAAEIGDRLAELERRILQAI
ncbi:MAG: hypothetical protein LLF99_06835 [Desulfobacteraceae bacterium]|nr:hypothetical protein [Desulfobacteraceae bacterium]